MITLWPFVHKDHVKALQDIIEIQRKYIAELESKLRIRREAPRQLDNNLMDKEGPPKQKKGAVVVSGGRGGWRGKAATLSEQTFPAPKDSVKALEERVRKEGGKV